MSRSLFVTLSSHMPRCHLAWYIFFTCHVVFSYIASSSHMSRCLHCHVCLLMSRSSSSYIITCHVAFIVTYVFSYVTLYYHMSRIFLTCHVVLSNVTLSYMSRLFYQMPRYHLTYHIPFHFTSSLRYTLSFPDGLRHASRHFLNRHAYVWLQDRTCLEGVTEARACFQHAAGTLLYVRDKFSHAPSMDMQYDTLDTLVGLMLVRSSIFISLENISCIIRNINIYVSYSLHCSFWYNEASKITTSTYHIDVCKTRSSETCIFPICINLVRRNLSSISWVVACS